MNQRSTIRLRGCREHNLRDLNVEFERGSLTAIVGPSGAGKRSLVFATLHAEAQRRFLQSCSLSERTRLESLSAPDLDSAENLILTQAIKADSLARGPRNTVGTETGLLARLQTLFVDRALPRCPACDRLVRGWTVDDIEQELVRVPDAQRVMLGFPFSETLPLADAFDWLNQAGFSRGIVGSSTVSFDQPSGPGVSDLTSEGLVVIVDRIKTGATGEARVRESLETCLRAGRGRCLILRQPERDLSPDESTEIVDGAAWMRRDFFRDLTCPGCLRNFPAPSFDLFRFTTSLGACPACHGRGSIRTAAGAKRATCTDCDGTRFGEIPRLFEWNGRSLPEYCQQSIRELFELFSKPEAENALDSESLALLHRLIRLNLGGLPLDLPATSLSGTEARRIALARADSSSCVGRMFLLDDPFEGTSEEEHDPILETIAELIAQGGTVCAICDHLQLLDQADRIVELGPGSGDHGGNIVYEGSISGWNDRHADEPNRPEDVPETRQPDRQLAFRDWLWPWATSSQLNIPVGRFSILAGSGATRPIGFLRHVLIPLLVPNGVPVAGTIEGREHVGEVNVLTTSPRTDSPRQLVVTAVRAFAAIRELLAATDDARKRNLAAGYFSLHKSDGGRCPQCLGVGRIDVELDFLPELPLTCPTCRGSRYRETVDAVRFRGLSVVEILDLSVDEAFRFFRGHPAIQKKLQRLRRVHLGYLKLGQPLDHLSRGERRRVELASVLGQTREAGTLLILEEPSIGLSQSEVAELANALHEYVLAGNTILAVDHHPRMIEAANVVLTLARIIHRVAVC